MQHPTLTLKKGKSSSVERFHPWVFSGAIHQKPQDLEEGQVVDVLSADGRFLGRGHYQVGSIMVRLFTFREENIDLDFWRKRLRQALSLRRRLGLFDQDATNMFRLIHGEGDGFPGLIVDFYGGVAVLQCHTVGFFLMREALAQLLKEEMGESLLAVYDKSEHSIPFKAPVSPADGYLLGEAREWIGREYGLQYRVDIEGGQKTGFFVDQRENRHLLRHYARDRKVLNAFCYTGGFSVAALAGRAAAVDSLDSSAKAMELTEVNVALNHEDAVAHRSLTEDALEFLKDIDQRYDLIVLDPPAFAKHQKVLDRALKGYRKINKLAFEQIQSGGLLFTFSCSQVVSQDHFRKAVFTAAAQSKRKVQVLHQLHQPPDHPVDIYHPEGEYLKGLVLRVI